MLPFSFIKIKTTPLGQVLPRRLLLQLCMCIPATHWPIKAPKFELYCLANTHSVDETKENTALLNPLEGRSCSVLFYFCRGDVDVARPVSASRTCPGPIRDIAAAVRPPCTATDSASEHLQCGPCKTSPSSFLLLVASFAPSSKARSPQ